MVGDGCIKKLCLKKNKNGIKKIIEKLFFEKHKKTDIENIFDYSENIYKKIINFMSGKWLNDLSYNNIIKVNNYLEKISNTSHNKIIQNDMNRIKKLVEIEKIKKNLLICLSINK